MIIRAGVQGTAHTLVTENDLEFAGHIVRSLESANQEVPKELMDLALKSSWFSNSRYACELSRGEYFSEKPIFLHPPKNGPAWESRDTLIPGQYYFCTKPKKDNLSAHSSNISARTPNKCHFYAQSNKKLAKSALYNIFQCFAYIFMI